MSQRGAGFISMVIMSFQMQSMAAKDDNYTLTRLIVEAGVIRALEYSDRKQYKLEFEAAM